MMESGPNFGSYQALEGHQLANTGHLGQRRGIGHLHGSVSPLPGGGQAAPSTFLAGTGAQCHLRVLSQGQSTLSSAAPMTFSIS